MLEIVSNCELESYVNDTKLYHSFKSLDISRRHMSNSNPFSSNSAVNLNGANFTNFENSLKIEQKSDDDILFTAVIRNESTFLTVRKFFGGVWGTLIMFLKIFIWLRNG